MHACPLRPPTSLGQVGLRGPGHTERALCALTARGTMEVSFWEMLSRNADRASPLRLPRLCPTQGALEAGLRVALLLLARVWVSG